MRFTAATIRGRQQGSEETDWSTVYAQKNFLFQPWAARYRHNHPDKTVGIAKAMTVTKDFAGHTSLAPHS